MNKPRIAYLLFFVTLLLLVLVAGWLWRGQRDPGAGLPVVLYLSWDEEQQPQLFSQRVGGEKQQLTGADGGVLDYRPAPDGTRIAYSARRDDGGADIWLVGTGGGGERLLLACPEAVCSSPIWRPDGRLVLFERRALPAGAESPGPPRLYWLDPAEGSSRPLFRETEATGQHAGFSADGRWLAYIAPAQQQLRIVNVDTNALVTIPNDLGERPVWHPQAPSLLFADVRLFQGEQFVNHIYRAALPAESTLSGEVNLPDEAITNLSGNRGFDDGSPTWAPDGQQLAFGRKLPRTSTGRQIWVMGADGGNQRPLTEGLSLQFSRPHWSPAGDQLLVQRFDIQTPAEGPGIWLLDVESGALTEVATPGFQASWLP